MAMKLFVAWVMSAGVIVTATAAGAQALSPQVLPSYRIGVSPYSTVSDVGGPYAAMPPDQMPPRYAPAMLPPREVYTVVRESGFSPLGAPQQRGFVYTIAVIDRDGEDGRLVIDARNGRIVRFMPAFRMGGRMGDMGGRMGDEVTMSYGPQGPLPPVTVIRGGVPRPPALVPHVASRSPTGVPLPKAQPRAVGEASPPAAPPAASPAAPVAATPAPAAPAQQSVAVQPRPAVAQAAVPAPVAAKPSAQILPTQEMPRAQGLD
jgi:hypothetical protein